MSLESLDLSQLKLFSMFIMKGWLGVDLFFILSGFILSYSYQERMRVLSFSSVRFFIINRLAKIFPAHLFVMLIFGIAVATARYANIFPDYSSNFGLQNYFLQIFLLHGIGIVEPRGWNLPTWSISSELLAYLLFPILVIILNKFENLKANLLLIVSMMMFLIFLAWNLNNGTKFMLDYQFSGLRVVSEFFIGICLCQIYKKLKKSYTYLIWIIMALIAIFLQTFFIEGAFYDFAYLIYFMILIPSLALLPTSSKRVSIFIFFGKTSYALYLIHSLVIIGLNQIIRKISFLQLYPEINLIAFLFLYIIISWFIYEKVEKTGQKFVISKLS